MSYSSMRQLQMFVLCLNCLKLYAHVDYLNKKYANLKLIVMKIFISMWVTWTTFCTRPVYIAHCFTRVCLCLLRCRLDAGLLFPPITRVAVFPTGIFTHTPFITICHALVFLPILSVVVFLLCLGVFYIMRIFFMYFLWRNVQKPELVII